MVDVVAALIWDKDKFMICQRPANKARAFLWEFVGGKVEQGETKKDALVRECREELDVTVSVGDVFTEVNHEYPDITIRLTLFNCTISDGSPTLLEHNALRWITPDEIPLYDFCPADTQILQQIIDRANNREINMKNKALVVIDIQNDITKNYKEIIGSINVAIDWAESQGMHVIYIKHNNISDGTRTFKPDTPGAELVPDMKIISDNIFVKTKGNALTSVPFAAFISENDINEFFIAGADAVACVKSTCFNMTKAGYAVHVLSDCITSYDKRKLPEMLGYYASKGCTVETLAEVMCAANSVRK